MNTKGNFIQRWSLSFHCLAKAPQFCRTKMDLNLSVMFLAHWAAPEIKSEITKTPFITSLSTIQMWKAKLARWYRYLLYNVIYLCPSMLVLIQWNCFRFSVVAIKVLSVCLWNLAQIQKMAFTLYLVDCLIWILYSRYATFCLFERSAQPKWFHLLLVW